MGIDQLTEWMRKNIGSSGTGGASAKHTEKQQRHPGHAGPAQQQTRGQKHYPQTHQPARGGPAGPTGRGGGVLRCVPLGGLDEVGKNMMVFEHANDIVVVDIGFQFPEEDMLGIDYVIPDISYLRGKESRIRGILLTHGHLDHIGAIPYLIEKMGSPPVFGTPLTLGLVKKRLEEFGLDKKVRLHAIDPDKRLTLGSFNCDFFRVNHSIPDGVGIVLRTPVATVVHTGDFKFDYTPVFQAPADYHKIAALGSQSVAALFSDSTNALNPGHTKSEKLTGENLDKIISGCTGRVIIAVFASSIGRIQLIVNSALKCGRKVFLSGRSMNNNFIIAQRLGFLKAPPGAVADVKKMGKMPDDKVLILTTGAQGEPVSALNRMSSGEHAKVELKKGDTVILSSTPIPGNERPIATMLNNLCRRGVRVVFHQITDVHTSGHANKEDLKLMISLVKPRNLVPVHGELFMRMGHGEIGRELGMKDNQIQILENGSILEIDKSGAVYISKERAQTNYIMIDGKGVSDTGSQIIMDRQIMAGNGVLIILITVNPKTKKIIGTPDIISRGFVYISESDAVAQELVVLAKKAYTDILSRDPSVKRGDVKKYIRGVLDRFTHRKLDRHPLILPVIAELDSGK
ncbi:MAG: ribonuclease J [Patescibacteria group bacterium]